MLTIDPASGIRDAIGEAPVWCPDEKTLYWIDWEAQVIRRWTPSTGEVRTWPVGEGIGSFCLRANGGAVLAAQSGFQFFDFGTGTKTFIINPDPDHPSHSLNDGRCDRRGRFWAGAMIAPLAALTTTDDASETGGLFFLASDLRARCARRGLLIANGIAWSPDDRTIYFGDSGRRAIFKAAYDIDDASIGEVSVFAETTGPGVPDGSTVDVDGCLWNAEYGGSRLVRYDPKGRIASIVPLPVTNPTSCTFGGESLNVLYVTTASWHMSPAQSQTEPLAGAVLAIDIGVKGMPDTKFAA